MGKKKTKPIRMVVQRCRTAKLLLHPKTDKTEAIFASIGAEEEECKHKDLSDEVRQRSTYVVLLVYIAFANGASSEMLSRAVKILLNLPILTDGQWGDGTKNASLLQMTADSRNSGSIGVMIVPQANLVSKVN